MSRRTIPGIILMLLVGAGLLIACAPAATPTPTPTKAAGTAPAVTTAAKTEPTKPAVTPTAAPKTLQKLKMTTPSVGLVELAQQMAKKKGFFADEGIDAEITAMKSDLAVKAMVGGEIDFTFSLGSSIRAASQGVGLKALMGTIVKPYHVVVVRPEIKEMKDLKGKLLGADATGSTTEVLMRAAVKHFGLDPEKDVTIMALGGNPERMAALKAGSIQGTVLEALYAVKAENEGLVRLVRMGDILDMPIAGLSATDKMIKERPALVLSAVKATVKGLKYIKDPKNKAEIIDYMVNELKVTKAEAEDTYPEIIRVFSDDGFVTEKGIKDEIKVAVDTMGAKASTTVADVFDDSFVKKVKAGNQ